jgi:serine/threonine protein kinase/tetratricopeptide (TPR) repeat protein
MHGEASVDDAMTEGRKEDRLPPISGPEPQESQGRADPVPEIEGYQVIARLGQGGMGAVWSAIQLSTRRKVALKVLRTEVFGARKACGRFEREVQLAARLQHPNIAQIFDSGLHQGMYYYAMEFIEGAPLDEYVRKHNLAHPGTLKLMRTLCDALQHAHQRGVIHRDLKPSNILVTADGQPHVVDFGLAKTFLEGDSSAAVSTTGETVGMPAYMSPEQALGRKTDWRSDIFSFGAVFYELLTGRRPFEGETSGEIVNAIITKEPVSIDILCPEIPTEFRRIVHKCLRKEPELRYQHVDDLLVDLRFLENTLESREALARKGRKCVAVLPFLNLSKSPDDEYFCEGMTEDITTDLSKIKELNVASRTLTRSLCARGLDVRVIGRELDVDSVLEGSVQRAGKRMRITAQLINVTDGFHLWAEKFDRETEDILLVQTEIAEAIAKALRVRLVGMDRDPLQRRGTRNPEAYEQFIKGRFLVWYKNTAAGLEAAEHHFQRALELDPSYAQAWVGLADIYNNLWFRGSPHRDKLVEQAGTALHHALQIDPEMSYGYATRAWYHSISGDAMLAARIVRDGLERNPDDPLPHFVMASFTFMAGDIEGTEQSARACLKIDPFMHFARFGLGFIEAWYRHDIEKALAHADEILTFAPDYRPALDLRVWCSFMRGEFEEALRLLHKGNEIDRPCAYELAMEAVALAGSNKPTEARAKIEEAMAANPALIGPLPDQLQVLCITIALSILGDLDGAFKWLGKAAQLFLIFSNPRLFEILEGVPALEPLRHDQRYEEIRREYSISLQRMKNGQMRG